MEKSMNRKNEEGVFRFSEKKLKFRIELMERDIGILEFILDMKFVRVSDVFEKFFKENLDGHPAVSDSWIKKRLFQLEQGKFLNSQYSHRRFSRKTRKVAA